MNKISSKTGNTTSKLGDLVEVTLIKSVYGRQPKHRACVRGLGLRRMHHTVRLVDTPCVRGMINKVQYLLKTTPIAGK